MRLQTAESVTIGHPDKLCDQISDTILDNYLARDPHARTAVETLASSHGVTVAGEINSTAVLNDDQIERIVRAVIQDVGYTRNNGYDPETIPVRPTPRMRRSTLDPPSEPPDPPAYSAHAEVYPE